MSGHRIIYLIVGLIGGFLLGFAFANGVNRRELDAARMGQAQVPSSANKSDAVRRESAPPGDDASRTILTDGELSKAVAKGDANPTDIALQRNLGGGLYLYAMKTRNTKFLSDAVRFLKRAHEGDPKDYETMVLLGEALFDAGQHEGSAARIGEARKYFTKALEAKPDDINVRTELGLTFFFDLPSNPRRAIQEYRKSLAIDPQHEMTLQSLAASLLAVGERAEAQKIINELQKANPSNAALPNLRTQLASDTTIPRERN